MLLQLFIIFRYTYIYIYKVWSFSLITNLTHHAFVVIFFIFICIQLCGLPYKDIMKGTYICVFEIVYT